MATIGSSMISQNVVGLHKDAGGGIEIINSYGNNQFNENGGPAVALGPATLQ